MYRVLIIDDEPWSREVVKALGRWEALGFEIAGEAEDGNSGLARIEALRPDVVITDMRMPGLDGALLLKAMNERFPEVKIIVVSGYDDFVYLKQAVTSRATDYLLKPIDPEELNAALAKCGEELDKRYSLLRERVEYAVFDEPARRATYLRVRERLRESLLALDVDGVNDSLRKLDDEMLAKTGQELILIVEQFAAENGIGLKDVWERGGRSFDGTADSLAYIYGEVLSDAIALRRNRNRLDLADVVAFLGLHYRDNVTLETAAGYFHVTKEHLSRAFKAHTGSNMTDYIARLRMDEARRLIEEGLPIKQAAEAIGYADVAYFYRVFKKHVGATPGELVKKRAADQNRTIAEDNILE
ncbi:response regulator [Cohnella sp. GCM10027633]|uniref:response regulator transcription factor n=1 Tax=unclassified Cohnella TaxID=2636738 RepID=UPI0036458F7E